MLFPNLLHLRQRLDIVGDVLTQKYPNTQTDTLTNWVRVQVFIVRRLCKHIVRVSDPARIIQTIQKLKVLLHSCKSHIGHQVMQR
jgi:hypothetical protein